MSRSRRRYDERGIALPTVAALGSAAAVLVAGGAFVATAGGAPAAPPATVPAATPARHVTLPPEPATVAPKPVLKKKHRTPDVRRGHTYVEVYNNSGITGLAGRTAKRIADAGWQVVGSDNWYGTIPSSTVYYPSRLHAEAKLLAKDLGIHRLHPAISPMKFDRLTVILTSG
ncbi:MAG TPA: LytR C-terminal domain-containing protein [Nocardioidaceae bacterium]|nr:LytR C-terminal domain-containing protein [Nocardioidaceae bacterium]